MHHVRFHLSNVHLQRKGTFRNAYSHARPVLIRLLHVLQFFDFSLHFSNRMKRCRTADCAIAGVLYREEKMIMHAMVELE